MVTLAISSGQLFMVVFWLSASKFVFHIYAVIGGGPTKRRSIWLALILVATAIPPLMLIVDNDNTLKLVTANIPALLFYWALKFPLYVVAIVGGVILMIGNNVDRRSPIVIVLSGMTLVSTIWFLASSIQN